MHAQTLVALYVYVCMCLCRLRCSLARSLGGGMLMKSPLPVANVHHVALCTMAKCVHCVHTTTLYMIKLRRRRAAAIAVLPALPLRSRVRLFKYINRLNRSALCIYIRATWTWINDAIWGDIFDVLLAALCVCAIVCLCYCVRVLS